MILEISLAYQGLMSIHSEWHARHIRVSDLGFGRQRADFVFVDDGPSLGRCRHPNIPYAIVFDRNTDWDATKLMLWQVLEDSKKRSFN